MVSVYIITRGSGYCRIAYLLHQWRCARHNDISGPRSGTVEAKMKTEYSKTINLLLSKFGEDLKPVVLFGSRARGDFSKDSDHDLLLISDNLPRGPIDRFRVVRTVLMESDLRIKTVQVAASEFTKDLSPLALDVCQDGICLHGNAFFEPLRMQAMAAVRSGP
jgi:predicted nucleotidyltransferase